MNVSADPVDNSGLSTNVNMTLAEVLKIAKKIDEMGAEFTLDFFLDHTPFRFWIIVTFGAIGRAGDIFFLRAKRNSKPKNNTRPLW